VWKVRNFVVGGDLHLDITVIAEELNMDK
jgi:hypothetical protein